MSYLVAITGGIGSGKSVVSSILREMGFYVYDCDAEARRIVDSDQAILNRIFSEIAPEAKLDDGSLDRRVLSEIVFNDSSKLSLLNEIVHHEVRRDIMTKAQTRSLMFFESAILYSSRFVEMADKVWEVTAPLEVRISRVMRRNGLSRPAVEKRIASQSLEIAPEGIEPCIIINDNILPLLPQIEASVAELI